jgi:putative ABC transport system permease protein
MKALFSMLGIGFAVALIMLSGFQESAMNYMVTAQFRLAQKQDVTIAFTEPVAGRALHELLSLPGVHYAESLRVVPVILRYGQREYHTAIQGFATGNQLFSVLDKDLKPMPIPAEGLLLTDYLAGLLGVKPGDLLQVSVQEGRRELLEIPVTGLVTEYVGVSAYMRQSSLSRLLHEDDTISGALLAVDTAALAALQRQLQEIPSIAGVVLREKTVRAFKKMMNETILVFTLFSLAMAGAIAFAVVYNNARIAFAERSRELASLRVLGFTRSETAYILLGELLVLTLFALPLGYPLGALLCWMLTWAMQTDLYRVPLILGAKAYTMACVVVLLATLISALIIIRALARLDMITALKAAE